MTSSWSSRLVLLLSAALTSAAVPVNNTGRTFIVVFPENVAYYHPTASQNKVWVTALHNGTQVNVSSDSQSRNLNAGQTTKFDVNVELKKFELPADQQNQPFQAFNISNGTTVEITSNKDIVVQAISARNTSVQTALVVPTDKLSSRYFIPPVPQIQGTTDDQATSLNVTERGPFRVIIVNPNQRNTVTIKGQTGATVTLWNKQVARIWVPNDQVTRVVEAEEPVAVLFSHPCAMETMCTCGLLYTTLPPPRNQIVRFPIPPGLAENASLLLSEDGSSSVKQVNPESAVVESSGTVVLYRPGLLLSLIPETEFGSCFLVPSIQFFSNSIIIVVHKNFTDGIHIGKNDLTNPEWQDLQGTEYVSTNQTVSSDKTVVWHANSKMAVYFVGRKNGRVFGNPAGVVSTVPDFRGCVTTSEVMKIQDVGLGWTESITSCKNESLELMSLSEARLQKKVCSLLGPDNQQNLWIGLRRSSKTGYWYWLNSDPVNETNWGTGEPGSVDAGQCAVMSVTSSDCSWKDENCCEGARPLCYRQPELLSVD